MSSVLGIDLGTTNSVVCVADGNQVRVLPDADGNLLIPSVVSFHPKGDVLVGHPARERRLLDARNTIYSIKRLIGRPYRSPEVRRAQERFPFELCEGPTKGVLVRARSETYTLPEISAFVLREVRRIAEARLGAACTQAVITVPANFNELQRSATKAAGRVAGLDVLRILNEPTAAALAYGYGRGSRERIAVFDLGGGTFDITVLELAGDVFEVLSTAGDTFLGGDDIDLLIAEKMADAFLQHHRFDPRTDPQAFERLRAAAEWAKCQLSAEEEVQLRVEELAYGEGGTSLDLSFGMTRTALEQLVGPLIARAFDVCNDAMRVAGVAPTQLDNVILVGGSTRIPLVRWMVAEYFGREPLSSIDPDLVVARGAALQASALAPQIIEGSGLRRPEKQGQLAKVALRKVSTADLHAITGKKTPPPLKTIRSAQIQDEDAARRPAQPAFSPPRVTDLPSWDELDEQPTRAAAKAYEDEGEEDTSVGLAPLEDEPTRAVARGVESSRPPPAAIPPRGVPQGAVTLGFGSAGFPVYDESDATTAVTKSSAPPPPPPSAARVAPPPPPRPLPPPVVPPPRGRGAPTPPPTPPVVPPPVAPPFAAAPTPPPFEPAPPPFEPAPPPVAPAPPFEPALPFEPAPTPAALPAPDPRSAGVPTRPPSVAPRSQEVVRPPLLLDVTPMTLGVETVGGFCESVIARNAAIPVEQTRLFTTGSDDQEAVSVRIYQGESRVLVENQALGMLVLAGLRAAKRGDLKIEVTFVMDADGTLSARAKDVETGRQQSVKIDLLGRIPEAEIEAMRERQARMLGA
ncbi:MAG: Hsp70 family protein [Sandaracinaceae bacterium]